MALEQTPFGSVNLELRPWDKPYIPGKDYEPEKLDFLLRAVGTELTPAETRTLQWMTTCELETVIHLAHIIEKARETERAQMQLALDNQKTQGRKGMKANRINMAFTPSNLDFIRVMAAVQGISMTEYVNAIIAKERERNAAAYEAANQISKELKSE